MTEMEKSPRVPVITLQGTVRVSDADNVKTNLYLLLFYVNDSVKGKYYLMIFMFHEQ